MSKIIRQVSEGILSTTVDLLLWELVYLGESMTTFSRNTWEPRMKADKFLEKVNYETLSRAIQTARRHGWIKKPVKRYAPLQITGSGKKRIASHIPLYDSKRIWDNCLYLITYDIPETKKTDRAVLRIYLKKLGAGMVQESVWITPYNPNDIMREFIEERNLEGTIIVSSIGKDGYIGQENIKELLARVNHLADINQLYQKFIENYADGEAGSLEIAFGFFAVLKTDPQLPFSLLPSDWQGEKAYKLFAKRCSKYPLL